MAPSKVFALLALVASASAFTAPMMPAAATTSTAIFNEGPKVGAGGMADTRDPDALEHDDKRKSISEAPSFEEYLKQREQAGN